MLILQLLLLREIEILVGDRLGLGNQTRRHTEIGDHKEADPFERLVHLPSNRAIRIIGKVLAAFQVDNWNFAHGLPPLSYVLFFGTSVFSRIITNNTRSRYV